MDWSSVVDKLGLTAAAGLSSVAFYKFVLAVIHSKKIRSEAEAKLFKAKAETEHIATETLRDVVVILRTEMGALNTKYQNLAKEFSNFKYRAAKELSEEKESCAKQIATLTIRLTQLEKQK